MRSSVNLAVALGLAGLLLAPWELLLPAGVPAAEAAPGPSTAPSTAPSTRPTAPAPRSPPPTSKRAAPKAAPKAAPRSAPKPHRPRPAKRRAGAPSKPRVVFDQGWAATPAARYAALERDACHAELRTRSIRFDVVAEARGVVAPVRLPADVGGIVWRTELPAKDRAHAPWDVFDCRVVLSMHDWAPRLRARGVVEVLLFSAWRPPPKTWPADKPATRHPGALAIDVKRLVRAEDLATGAKRTSLDVERDWAPRIGAPVCGPDAPAASPDTPEAREIRAIACEVEDARLFTVMLTPHYDRAHHNHLHLELTPGVTWRLTR